MSSGDDIAASPIKALEPANPEAIVGEDGSPVSGDSVPVEGFILGMSDTVDIKKMFEDMFADRFTERDEDYQEHLKKSGSEPPIVEEWNHRNHDRYRDNRRNQSWDNRRDSYNRRDSDNRRDSYNSYNQHHGGRGWGNSPHQYRQDRSQYHHQDRHQGYNSGGQRYQPYR